MKVLYKHLIKHINANITVNDLSNKLFQLGHEHEIYGDIFDMELTPNRGDCLSITGLLRDLKLFFDINLSQETYNKKIDSYKLNFVNNAKNDCKKISFLKITIDDVPSQYNDTLNSYFEGLSNKKINFFTDLSNYLSYETGQPTHCYDEKKLNNYLTLDYVDGPHEFETLAEKIKLSGRNLVFKNKENEIINLAGIIGGNGTCCDKNTKTVIVECAHFNPEAIIGKSVKYDISSDAAHKFERSTDPQCHDYVLRRFLKLVEEHTSIKEVKIYSGNYGNFDKTKIPFNASKINKILGIDISSDEQEEYLNKLGFSITNNKVSVPSYRNDVQSIYDLSEEIARAIGYDNIINKNLDLSINEITPIINNENKIKKFLVQKGFYEVINYPFTSNATKKSVQVDNPLDSNKNFLRIDLKQSLIENLLYNERRQQDSVKLFEISNIYSNEHKEGKKVIGIIASGRVDKNYRDFSKKISDDYIREVLNSCIQDKNINFFNISRSDIGSKLKNHISYTEFDIDESIKIDIDYGEESNINKPNIDSIEYVPISEYPISTRDLSFSITNPSKLESLKNYLLTNKHDLLKEVYIFDYYNNYKNKEIKIGFRFTFQSKAGTLKDSEIEKIINKIIIQALQIESVSIPGLNI